MKTETAQNIWRKTITPVMDALAGIPALENMKLLVQVCIVTRDGTEGVKVACPIGVTSRLIDLGDPAVSVWKKLASTLVATALQSDAMVTQHPDNGLTGFCKQSNRHLPTQWIVTVITEHESPLWAETLVNVIIPIIEACTQLEQLLPP